MSAPEKNESAPRDLPQAKITGRTRISIIWIVPLIAAIAAGWLVFKNVRASGPVITIQFNPVPHQSFPQEATGNWQPNRLVINIQPTMGIRLRFQAKRPGLKMLLQPVDMLFNYADSYTSGTPEAYETLLLDIMEGDSTLFMRADQVEAAWEILKPIINKWDTNPSVNFPNYAAGMQGPEDSEALIAKDGNNWTIIPPISNG